MKKAVLLNLWLFIFSISDLVSCMSHQPTSVQRSFPNLSPIFDEYLGQTEKVVLGLNGLPSNKTRLNRQRLRDELRQKIQSRLKSKFVDELEFIQESGILYVWIEERGGSRLVIGDVFAPKGTEF